MFGVLALLWCLAWWWAVEDSPDQDRSITDQELQYLRTTVSINYKLVNIKTIMQCQVGVTVGEEAVCHPPWAAMLSSRAVWAIIIAHFTENWGFYSE